MPAIVTGKFILWQLEKFKKYKPALSSVIIETTIGDGFL